MKEKEKTSLIKKTIAATVLFFIAAALIIIGGTTKSITSVVIYDVLYGVKGTFQIYASALTGKIFDMWTFVGLVILAIDLFGSIFLLLYAIKKKKNIFIFPIIINMIVVAFVPYLLTLVSTEITRGIITPTAFWFIFIALTLDIVGAIVLINVLLGLCEEKVLEKETVVKEVVTLSPTHDGLKQDEVREIVKEELKNHEAALHQEQNVIQPKPVEEANEVEMSESEDPFAKFGDRRKLSFEVKLKKSDKDLRKKYYDLRDYIKGYGVNNRVSLKGDTFSLHRERYVFVTVSGKHIKAYFALDPKDYENTTMPAKANERKKYEDLPLQLDIRSDLSYRRAVQLVDDLMKKKGIEKKEKKNK